MITHLLWGWSNREPDLSSQFPVPSVPSMLYSLRNGHAVRQYYCEVVLTPSWQVVQCNQGISRWVTAVGFEDLSYSEEILKLDANEAKPWSIHKSHKMFDTKAQVYCFRCEHHEETNLFLISRYIGTCVGPWTHDSLTYNLQFKRDGSISGTCAVEENAPLQVSTIARIGGQWEIKLVLLLTSTMFPWFGILLC